MAVPDTAGSAKAASKAAHIAEIQRLNSAIALADAEIGVLRNKIAERDSQIADEEAKLAPESRLLQPETVADRDDAEIQEQGTSLNSEYARALAEFADRKYAQSIARLDSLYRNNRGHTLAGNFLYWQGEAYFAQEQFNPAIDKFQKVLQHKSSFKSDDAIYMLGRIYDRKGERSLAHEQFSRLIDAFPKSEYALRAQNYIQSQRVGAE